MTLEIGVLRFSAVLSQTFFFLFCWFFLFVSSFQGLYLLPALFSIPLTSRDDTRDSSLT